MKNLIDDAIVLTIDMINDVVDPGEEFFSDRARRLIPKLRALLDVAREGGVPIVHAAIQDASSETIDRLWPLIRDGVSCVAGTAGVEIADELRPPEYSASEVYMPKHKYTCFYGTRLDTILRNPPFRDRNTIIITGMNTNMCCLATAIDAFNRDYDVIFVDDLNCTAHDGVDGTPAATMHAVTVETLKQAFVKEVVFADDLIARLEPSAASQSQ